MKKGESVYRKLKKQGFSDKDIAEAFVLPPDLTKKETAKSDKQLSEYFRSREFKKSMQKQIKKDTWGKGLPMVYVNDKGQIVNHWKSGKIEIILYKNNPRIRLTNGEAIKIIKKFAKIIYESYDSILELSCKSNMLARESDDTKEKLMYNIKQLASARQESSMYLDQDIKIK